MDSRFIVTRSGKQFCLYAGLLDEAHRQGLKRITTMLIQVPAEDNGHTAIVTAEVETERGAYSGIGDASPQSVARPMVPHIVRLAETRAKARALRDAVNVAVAALEELGGDVEDAPVSNGRTPASAQPRSHTAQRETGYAARAAR
jgi:hypothetical protein